MPNEPIKRVDFSKEEVAEISSKLDALLKEYKADFVVAPIINRNGTLGASVSILRKVEELKEDIKNDSVE